MRVSHLANIPDPYARFIQSQKFLRSLKATESKAAEICDRALLDCLEQGMKPKQLADDLGVTRQRIDNMKKRAKARFDE